MLTGPEIFLMSDLHTPDYALCWYGGQRCPFEGTLSLGCCTTALWEAFLLRELYVHEYVVSVHIRHLLIVEHSQQLYQKIVLSVAGICPSTIPLRFSWTIIVSVSYFASCCSFLCLYMRILFLQLLRYVLIFLVSIKMEWLVFLLQHVSMYSTDRSVMWVEDKKNS